MEVRSMQRGTARALTAAAVIVIALLSLSADVGSDDAAASGGPVRRFPETTDGIFVFNDQIAPSNLTDAQVRFAATHYVGSQKMRRSEARQLRRHNPNFLVLHYRLAQALGHSPADEDCNPTHNYISIVRGDEWVREWPADEQLEEQWFYHWNSSRVYCCDWGHYLMDIADPGWREWWSSHVIEELIANENDGVFADSFHVPNYGFTWNPALPVVAPAFEAEWARRQHNFTDYMRRRFAGRWKWIPNIGGFITTRDPSDYANVDGVMIEGFAVSEHYRWLPMVDWELQMDRILPLLRADKILIAQSYPELSDVEERLFILSCYLLVKGRYTYINLDLGTAPEWLPEYNIDLGPPKDPLPESISELLHPEWAVYARGYAKGMVLVNPTKTPREFDLGRTYYAVHPRGGGFVPKEGTAPGSLSYRPVRTMTLGAHRGAVLLDERPAAVAERP